MEGKESEEMIAMGLRLFSTNRMAIRSVTRALEDQIAGFLYIQINTGRQHTVEELVNTYLMEACTTFSQAQGNNSDKHTQVEQLSRLMAMIAQQRDLIALHWNEV